MDVEKKLNRALFESRRPSAGIWYYVYLHPEWKLCTFKDEEYGPLGHVDAWEKYVLPDIVNHYDLNKSVAAKIQKLHYAMPRGRITYVPKDMEFEVVGEKPGHWYLHHGNDTPGDPEIEQRKIMYEFNLYGLAARGIVHWDVAPHEKTAKTQPEEFYKLINQKPK